ncbi:MAG: NADH-quinone oxidoreductase subunit NuoH [Pyrinomonas sp.]|uniref:NADH-quinone oxidoreductase subunit NuoH n=1 Tax=Pyrinomonas sp. TaxID=2080306 RepID=UPI00333092E4
MDLSNPYIQAALQFLAIFITFNVVLMIVAYTVLAERRILGFIQGRLGPNRVGPGGVLQPFADLLKFIFKEEIVPDKSTRFVYFLAPVIAVTSAMMTLIVYPFGPRVTLPYFGQVELVIARFDIALLYVLAVTSIGVYGIVLAGWASNSKYSLMGGLRSSAQMISYELSLGLSLVGVILMSGTLDLYEIVEQQSGWYGAKWNIFPQFIGFIVYLTSAIAETNRVPFDLPEAETELVAGFHTEYSALKFALFFMAEYINMFTVSVLATTLFLGGWNVPGLSLLFAPGSVPFAVFSVIGFFVKVFFFLFLYIWLRGTLPRFRFDQLMAFGWKFLLPVALLNVVLTATLVWLGVL